MGDTNYSYKTSLPAYREDQTGKQAQKQKILAEIIRMGGAACLKQIEKFMHLPQSTCSGRINDLIEDGKIKHDGHMEFEGRLRKKFVIINQKPISISPIPVKPGQQELFG